MKGKHKSTLSILCNCVSSSLHLEDFTKTHFSFFGVGSSTNPSSHPSNIHRPCWTLPTKPNQTMTAIIQKWPKVFNLPFDEDILEMLMETTLPQKKTSPGGAALLFPSSDLKFQKKSNICHQQFLLKCSCICCLIN